MDLFGRKSSDTVNLYFVQDVESNSKEMRDAFKICQNAKLKPNIVGEDEVEDIPIRMNCVFVLEEFKGKTFMYLASKDCLVVGPRCLSICIKKRIPIPENQSPVFSLAMHGLVICASKLKRSKKEELASVVGYMGGSYSDQLTLAVTHLIADDCKSIKCAKAYEHKIPVMSSSWVKAVWEASVKSDVTAQDPDLFSKHRLPTLKGIHVTCSNLAQSVKLKLQKLIEENGGVYMPALEQNKTTVLVIGDPADGKKFQHAQLWGIPCVKPSWIHECVEKRYQVPYKDHVVVARPTCSTPTSELPSFMSNDVSVVPIVNDVSHLEINETNTSLSSTVSVKSCPKKMNKMRTQPNNSYKKYLEQLNMSEVSSAGLFLDGCKIYLSGFVSQEIDKLKRVLNIGGATIFSQLTDSVSHVIVGDFNLEDAKAIAQCSQRPHVVTVEWLIASIKYKGSAPVQQYLCLQANGGKGLNECPPQLSSPLGSKGIELLKKPSSSFETPATTPVSISKPSTSRKLFVKAYNPNRSEYKTIAPDRSTAMGSAKSSGSESNLQNDITSLATAKPQERIADEKKNFEKSSTNSNEEQQPTSSGMEQGNTTALSDMPTISQVPFFQGLLFMAVGFENATPIIEPIEKVGGCVVNPSQFQGVADYAIVPLDGTPEKFSSLETVTVLWVEDCWEQGKVLPVEYYHQPITMKEGCCPLEGVTLCITGFIGKERSYIGHVATSLGAVVQDSFSRKDHPDKGILRSTHLVCKSPQGSKYTAAKKWGLPAVTKEWLSACATSGVKIPEENYCVAAGEVTTRGAITTIATVEPPAVKRLKTSNEDRSISTGVTLGIVETTPSVANMKRPEPMTAVPSNSSTTPTALIRKLALEEREVDRAATTINVEDVVVTNAEDKEEEEEDDDFQGFQTPLLMKSRRLSKMELDESLTEEKRQEFLNPNDKRRLSCSSVGPSPGHVDTPNTPYGQVFSDATPSPRTRKRWKKWIDNLPDLYEGSPIYSRQRKPSTPLNVLMKQLWVKFGGVEIDGIQAETGDLLPEGPYSTWAHDKSHNDIEVENGELVIKGTNLSSGDLLSQNRSSQKHHHNKEKSGQEKSRRLSSQERNRRQSNSCREETDSDSSDSIDELPPTQLKEVMSERLAKRIRNTKLMARGEDIYDFDDDNGRGLKRKSDEESSICSDWDWTPFVSIEHKKSKSPTTGSSGNGNGVGKQQVPDKCKSSEEPNGRVLEADPNNKEDLAKEEDDNKEEDEEEEDEEEESMPKERRVFVLSNIPNPRDKYESIIHNLGGETNLSASYDPETTHLIIDKPVRSEKLLCCMASGKWVLHISYLTSCYQARTFLPEEDYEWGNERSKDRLPSLNYGSTEYELAMAAYRWRVQRTELGKVGAYSKFKAVLLTSEQKTPQYSRLLIAGGATVLDKSQILNATHVFWDEDKVELPISKQKLKAKKILLLKPIYLGDYLMKSQPPKPVGYIIK